MTLSEESFGAWLKLRRKALDLTQEMLAYRVGCSAITIRKIEAGALRPSRQIALRLATCCDVPPEDHEPFVRFARSEPHEAGSLPGQAPPTLGQLPPSNLPLLPTALIGRADDVERICSHLQAAAVRLLTLTGPPGIGKTSLALQVGHALRPSYTDGVFWVNLAQIDSEEQVFPEIAYALGVSDTSMRSLLDALVEWLSERTCLLILDNFEHVRSAAAALSDLLNGCPQLKILVTSREILRVRWERRYPITPLPLPTSDEYADLAALAEVPAVALFVDRAQSVNPDFVLTPENAPIIADICTQLEGVPLSIELIAARTTLLTPEAMRSRLKDQLALLTHGSRDLPSHQQTLRDAIQWSFDLLEPHEQRLFTGLGVFPASYTIAAAERICEAYAAQPWSMLDGLAALVDKSLLLRNDTAQGHEPRFSMFQVIREFARELFQSSGQAAELQQRHAEYYLDRAETIRNDLASPDQARLLAELDYEAYNIRAALTWFFQRDQTARGLRLAALLSDFWQSRGLITEGRRWMEQGLAAADRNPESVSPEVWIEALNSMGFLAYHQSDYNQAKIYFSRSLEAIKPSDDELACARLLNNLGLTARWHGDLAEAARLFEESMALWQRLGIAQGIAFGLGNMGQLAYDRSDFARARELARESLDRWRLLGLERGEASALLLLGQVAAAQGENTAAQSFLAQSLAISERLGHRPGMVFAQIAQAQLALGAGNLDGAHQLLAPALQSARELDNRHLVSLAARLVGRALIEQGERLRAELLLSDSLNLTRSMGYRVGEAMTLRTQGLLALERDPAGAQVLMRQACALVADMPCPGLLAWLAEGAALAAAAVGEGSMALTLFDGAAAVRAELGEPQAPLEARRIKAARAALGARREPAGDTEPGAVQPLALMHELLGLVIGAKAL